MKQRLLVIDDDVGMNGTVVNWLSRAGFEVEHAFNGEDGLILFGLKRFDLLITEVVLPVKDGIEILSMLKRNDSAIPVIAISGGGRIGPCYYLKLARFFGADRTLRKPLGERVLIDVVNELLGKGGHDGGN